MKLEECAEELFWAWTKTTRDTLNDYQAHMMIAFALREFGEELAKLAEQPCTSSSDDTPRTTGQFIAAAIRERLK